MAAPVFTSNLTLISDADSSTGWTNGVTNTETFVQGSASQSDKISQAIGEIKFDHGGAGGTDMTGEHLYIWANVSTAGKLAVKASGGIRIKIEDASGTTGYWRVDGSDTYSGGWVCYVQDVDAALDVGAPSLTTIRYVGVEFNVASMISGNIDNCFVDVMRTHDTADGPALTVTRGDGTTPITWQRIYDDNNLVANKYGVLLLQGGAFVVRGRIDIGTATASSDTQFTDSGAVVLWDEDANVATDYYRLRILDGATSSQTVVEWGTNTSGDLVSNGLLIVASANRFSFDINTDNNASSSFSMFGCTMRNATNVEFGDAALDLADMTLDLLGCTFEGCTDLTIASSNTAARVKNCAFNNFSGADAILMRELADGVWESNTLAGHTNAIQLPTTNTITLKSTTFAGNTTDVEFAANATLNLIDSTTLLDATVVEDVGTRVWTLNQQTTFDTNVIDSGGIELHDAGVRMADMFGTEVFNERTISNDTANALTFVEGGGSADTITRPAGSFVTDGFLAGDSIRVSGTASNDGLYTLDTAVALTLTLVATDDLAAEVGVLASITTGLVPPQTVTRVGLVHPSGGPTVSTNYGPFTMAARCWQQYPDQLYLPADAGGIQLGEAAQLGGFALAVDPNQGLARAAASLVTNLTIERTTLIKAAVADDGGVQSTETTAANNATTNDMQLTPATPVVGDAYFFGFDTKPNQFDLTVGQVTGDAGQTVVWKYNSGAGYVALSGVVDGTDSFKTFGRSTVSWTSPADWAKSTENALEAFFLKAEVTVIGGAPQPALGTQAFDTVPRLKLGAAAPDRSLQDSYDITAYQAQLEANMDISVPMSTADGATFVVTAYNFLVDARTLTGAASTLSMATRDFEGINLGAQGLNRLTDIDGTQAAYTLSGILPIEAGPDVGAGFDFNNVNPDTLDRNDGGSWLDEGYVVGMSITVTLATVGGNNGTYEIAALTATTLTLSGATFTTDLLDTTAVITPEASEVRIYDGVGEIAGIEDAVSGLFSYAYQHSVDVPVTVVVFSKFYLPVRFDDTLTDTSRSVAVRQIFDRNYSNP